MSHPSSPDAFDPSHLRTCEHSRRDFLRGATAAAGMLASSISRAAEPPLLPTVPFGPYRVTKMITGSNPIFGYSHFNRLLDQIMVDYFTDERVAEFLLQCEKAGINTYQSNYRERAQRQYKRMREAGCKVNWICLGDYSAADAKAKTTEEITAAMAKCVSIIAPAKPIGIAHHGSRTDFLWQQGKLDLIKDFLKSVHDAGFMAGISTHIPAVVETAEEKGWPTDFYMTCFYRMSRLPEDYQKEIGVIPAGETYLETDPPRMCQVVRRVKKPCLGFKILAAGRKCESSEQVRAAFDFALKNIKPTDAVIVGMFPRFSDQLSENIKIVRELTA
jgi:hypothetical protein